MPRPEYHTDSPVAGASLIPNWLRRLVARWFGLVEPPPVDGDESLAETLSANYGTATARVWRVHDGDTIVVGVEHWPPIVGQSITVRLIDIDAPELKDPRPAIAGIAEQARDYLTAALPEGAIVLLRNMRRDKYFRIVAEVVTADNTNLGPMLYTLGLARRYSGRGPKPW